jgi:hypothetical protein
MRAIFARRGDYKAYASSRIAARIYHGAAGRSYPGPRGDEVAIAAVERGGWGDAIAPDRDPG